MQSQASRLVRASAPFPWGWGTGMRVGIGAGTGTGTGARPLNQAFQMECRFSRRMRHRSTLKRTESSSNGVALQSIAKNETISAIAKSLNVAFFEKNGFNAKKPGCPATKSQVRYHRAVTEASRCGVGACERPCMRRKTPCPFRSVSSACPTWASPRCSPL